jgi:hypothetical protein
MITLVNLRKGELYMKKLLLVTALSAFTILSVTSASAQEVSATTKSSGELVQTNLEGEPHFHNKEEKERVRRETDRLWTSYPSNSANYDSRFTVIPNYGHLKLFFKNLSSYPVTVNLQHPGTNKVYFVTTIDAKSSFDWKSWDDGFPQGMRTGKYIIQWSGGEHKVNGKMFGKLASLIEDFH